MKNTIRTGCAGLLISLVAVASASAADVTVRIEGATASLANKTVAQTGPAITKNGATCAGDTAAAALERATAGDWTGPVDPMFGLSVQRILTESYSFDSGRYWASDVNNHYADSGVCDQKAQAGDELLFYVGCFSATSGCSTGTPLDIKAPATVQAGTPFSVQVDQYDELTNPATKSAASAASVSGGGATATTNASGSATVTIAEAGTVTLTATKGTQVRDSATVVVTAPPVYGIPTPTVTATPTVEPGDTTAPESRITNIKEGKRFKKGKGPRTIKATVVDEGGLSVVKLALTRRVGKRCTAYNVAKDRFVKVKCGKHPRHALGDRGDVSVLLPSRLKAGRYVLDVVATDKAGNAETLARGRNRVVFTVK